MMTIRHTDEPWPGFDEQFIAALIAAKAHGILDEAVAVGRRKIRDCQRRLDDTVRKTGRIACELNSIELDAHVRRLAEIACELDAVESWFDEAVAKVSRREMNDGGPPT